MQLAALMMAAFAASLVAQTIPQTTVSTQALTAVGAGTASSAGTTVDAVAAGTPIGGSPTNLFLQTSQNTAGYQSATTICYPTQPYQGGIGVNFFERAYARGDAAAQAGTVAGGGFAPHAILATFNAAPGTAGNLILQFRKQTAAGGRTSFAMDVGNDGVIDAQGNQATTVTLPYTFGASGSVAVRVDNECFAVGNGSTSTMYSWTEIWIGFRPDLTATSTIAAYGQSCGPTAVGSDLVVGNQRILTMLVTGCYPNSPVIAVTGTQANNLQLPGGCSLLCSGEAITLLNADATGLAAKTWSIPVTAIGTAFHQFLPITLSGGNLVITASNGVRIDCVR